MKIHRQDQFEDNRKTPGKSWRFKAGFRLCFIIILVTFYFLFVFTPVSAGDTSRTIILHGGDWDSFKLNNAIVSYILKNGYGYDALVVPGPEKTVAQQLTSGEVDVRLEVWKENHPPSLQEGIDAGKIIDAGRIFDHAAHVYIIPRHIAERYNISTLEDLKQYWYLGKDPEDPSKGLLFSGLITWLSHDATLKKMDYYGLSSYFNPVTMPSGRAYEAIFMKAAEQNRTVFGLYWTPSSVMGTGYWKVVTEPGNTSSCLHSASENTDLGEVPPVCPFQESDVHKLYHPGLKMKAPELVQLFSSMTPGEDEISRILAMGCQLNEHDWNVLAEQYLRANRDRWQSWVSPEAYGLISKALNTTGVDKP